MARANEGWVSLGPLKGQNTSDNPLTLGEGWATDTLNIVLDPLSSLAVKRRGSTALALPANAYCMGRHIPIGGTEHDAELWVFAGAGVATNAWRKIGAAPFVPVTGFPPELIVTRPLSFNGKLFLAGYGYTVNRLYVWDGTQVRHVGIKGSPIAPTGADFGTGTYPAAFRAYKVDWVYVKDGVTQSRSELSFGLGYTSSGTGTGVRVTRPVAGFEYATHWRVWGSPTSAIYFKLSGNIPIATTTYDDTVLPAAYAGEVAPEIGAFLPPPAATRIITDGHRLLLAASFPQTGPGAPTQAYGETAPRTNRIWYTPVLGTLDQGDDERIPNTSDQKNFLDIGDPPTGDITELGGPMDGQMFAFAKHRTWRLVPTGDLTTPYVTYPVTMVFGAGEAPYHPMAATALGETEAGRPAIYFFDESAGLYRITSGDDVQYVSYDIQSEIIALRPRLWGGAMSVFSWPEAKQTWWLVTLNAPFEQRIYVFHWDAGVTESHSVSGGWTKWVHGDPVGSLPVTVLHNRIPGNDSAHGKSRVPYAMSQQTCYIFDRGEAIDGATPYSGSVTCAPLLPANAQEQIRVAPPTIITTPHLMTRLTVSSVRDFGTETRSADIWLAPEGNETAVVRTPEGLYQGDCTAIQITIADTVPNPELWQIHLATLPVSKQQPR
jgi:hypothetical protein